MHWRLRIFKMMGWNSTLIMIIMWSFFLGRKKWLSNIFWEIFLSIKNDFTVGGVVVTFLQPLQVIAKKLILLCFVSSKPFSDWKSVKISRTAPRFPKILPPWNFFFEKFQNVRRELPNGTIFSFLMIFWRYTWI